MIIIGGTGKIGSRLVEHFSEKEKVVFTYFSNKTKADELSRRTGAVAVELDLGNPNAWNIPNPGEHKTAVISAGKFFIGKTPGFEEIEEGIRINLTGISNIAFYLAKNGIRNIVLISDISGFIPYTNHPINSIAAAGQHMLIKTISKIFAPDVLANAIALGALSEPFEGYTKRLPMKRLPDLDELIRIVEFLAYENTYMTGEILKIDGGRTLI